MSEVPNGVGEILRVTPTGAIRTSSWRIVPNIPSDLKPNDIAEMVLDADALERYEEFNDEMHAVLQKY